MPQPKSSSATPRSKTAGTKPRSKAAGKAKPKPASAAKAKPASAAKPRPSSAAKRKPASAAKPKPASAAKRKPASAAKAKPAPAAKPKASSAAKPKAPPAAKPRAATSPEPEPTRASLAQLRDRLLSSLTLSTDRVQEVTDDLVRRGRMTRQDAEDLLVRLTTAGRTQTEQIIADLEQLLGRSRATRPASRVLREVDRARRAVGGTAGFPIAGYDDLTASQITSGLSDLTPAHLRKVRDYERRNANRKSVLGAIDKALK